MICTVRNQALTEEANSRFMPVLQNFQQIQPSTQFASCPAGVAILDKLKCPSRAPGLEFHLQKLSIAEVIVLLW